MDCTLMLEELTLLYYEFLHTNNINLDDYNNNNSTCNIQKDQDIHTLSCPKKLQTKKNSRYNVINNITSNKDFQSGGKILSVVSGWWNLTKSKSNIETYFKWFDTSLKMNMPYVIFTDYENFGVLAKYRVDLCTVFVPRKMSEFLTHDSYNEEWTHPYHVPSRELGMTWLEKINLVMEASKIVDSEYLAWVDAGYSAFRSNQPPPDEWLEDVIRSLHFDRIGYMYIKESRDDIFRSVFDADSIVAGCFFIMHRNLVPLVHFLFYTEYNIVKEELNDWRCGSDQVIFTRLRGKYPELFHPLTYDFGDLRFLWGNKYNLDLQGPSNQEIDWDF